MSVTPLTRPASGSAKDYEEIANAYDRMHKDRRSKFSQSVNQDPRFTTFVGWSGVIFGGIITTAVCWGAATLVGMKSDIAVLLARPDGVPRAEYAKDANRWDAQLSTLEREIREQRERMRR